MDKTMTVINYVTVMMVIGILLGTGIYLYSNYNYQKNSIDYPTEKIVDFKVSAGGFGNPTVCTVDFEGGEIQTFTGEICTRLQTNKRICWGFGAQKIC